MYTKGTKELVYYYNTTGDANAPDTIEDGGPKAPEVRKALADWLVEVGALGRVFLGKGDHQVYNSMHNLYEDTYIIEVEDLPAPEPLPPENPRDRKFQIE